MIAERLLTILAAALGIALFVQTLRLHASQGELEGLKASIAQAQTETALRGAETGLEAVTHHVDRTQKAAPAVARAVARIQSECVRPEGDLSLPRTSGHADEAPAGTGDGFADALGRDLAVCHEELSKLTGLQEWVRANSEAGHD